MRYVLSPRSEELVRQMISSGRYDNANAVLEDALLALDEQYRLEQLRAALDGGEAEFERGEIVLYTPEVFDEIMQNVTTLAREGRRSDSDVRP